MYRFFVEESQINGNRVHITGTDVNHMQHVLRMKQGEEVCISTGGDKEYRCAILDFLEDEVLLEVRFVKENDLELASKIYLFQGLPKNDKMELIVQKAVELGVYEIIPVATKRAVVKLDDKKATKKVERWNSISEGGAKQSGRNIVPKVKGVMTYKEAMQYAKDLDVVLLPYELAEGMEDTKQSIEAVKAGMSVGIFIGPEGGFETSEVEYALEQGAKAITLGRRILRTETAGLTILSILMYHLECETHKL